MAEQHIRLLERGIKNVLNFDHEALKIVKNLLIPRA